MNLTWASLIGNAVLVVAVVVLLTDRGKLTAEVKTLERQAEAVAKLRQDDAVRITKLGEHNSALLTASAQACGAEGSTAFDRGVRAGMAVCEARRPQ